MQDTMTDVSRRQRRRAAQSARRRAKATAVGRATTTVLASTGLVISVGAAAGAEEVAGEGRGSAVVQLTAAELTVDRVSTSAQAAVATSDEVEVSFQRPAVRSEPAAPLPEPVVEENPPAPAEGVTVAQSQPAAEQTETSEQPQEQPAAQESSDEPAETSSETSSTESQEASESTGSSNSVVSAAYSGIGAPYSWGGTTPAGFDCSGFINWAYAQAGRGGLPRTTYGMEAELTHVSTPQPGDIVLANNTTHGAIYVGNGQVISSTPSGGVRVHGMNERWHQVNAIVRPN